MKTSKTAVGFSSVSGITRKLSKTEQRQQKANLKAMQGQRF
jgi:hypothetical protein